MEIIGIVGKSGSGKNFYSQHLLERGFPVLDCDEVSREVFNENLNDIYIMFNTYDKAKLSNMVFKNPAKLEKLENFELPLIDAKIEKWL
jgi:dephospho-CoA kinase